MGEMLHIPLIDHKSEVRTLNEIKVPEKFFIRVKMGIDVLDELFGGQEWPGILPGASILFSGAPGAGKSTAALQFADLIQQSSGRRVLYNCGEENEYMVKMRADRLGLTGEFGLSCIDDVDDLIRTCRDMGVEVLFTDSLQSLRMRGDLSTQARLKAITKRLHRFAKDTDTIVWIIGHVTKAGDAAGPEELKHDVDVNAHIRLDPKTLDREFILQKNRHGPAGIPYGFNLTARGIDFAAMVPGASEVEEKKGGKAAERREAYEKVIHDALLKGDMISAYDQGRYVDPFSGKTGADCSPSAWRAMLEKVVSSLQAEGKEVQILSRNSRRHYAIAK